MPRRRRSGWDSFDDAVSQIPGIGELTGADSRVARRKQAEERRRQREAEERAMAEWEGLGGRADSAYADQLRAIGGIPEEEYVEGTAQTAGAASAAADPRTIDAQMRALAAMEDVYGQGGLTAIDRARIAQAQSGQRTYERGQREALAQDAEARGMGAGGTRFAGEMMAQQQGAQSLNQMGLDIEGMAQERAFDAMQAAGGMAGQARGQGFEEEFRRREAQDAANRFNTEYARGRAARAQQTGERAAYGRSDAAGDYYGRYENIAARKTGQYNRQQDEARSREQTAAEQEDEANNYLINAGRSLAGFL